MRSKSLLSQRSFYIYSKWVWFMKIYACWKQSWFWFIKIFTIQCNTIIIITANDVICLTFSIILFMRQPAASSPSGRIYNVRFNALWSTRVRQTVYSKKIAGLGMLCHIPHVHLYQVKMLKESHLYTWLQRKVIIVFNTRRKSRRCI